MDQGPLVKDDILAGAELARRFVEIQPLKAAFWLRGGDDDDRHHLYLAVEGLDGAAKGPAYFDVSRVADDMADPFFDSLRVKVIGEKNPMARAAIELNQNFPDDFGHRLRTTMFGDVFAEEVFVYPTFVPASVG